MRRIFVYILIIATLILSGETLMYLAGPCLVGYAPAFRNPWLGLIGFCLTISGLLMPLGWNKEVIKNEWS